MKRSMTLIGFALLAVAPALSGDSRREKMDQYTSIEVAAPRNKVGDVLEEKAIDDLEERIVAAINESKVLVASENRDLKFPRKDPDDDTKVIFMGSGKEEDKKTIVLFTELITFNKGSRAKRYLIGGGTGRAELRDNCYLVDKSTGKQLYNFQSFGETNWGLAGGGSDKTLKGFASRVVGFLKGKY